MQLKDLPEELQKKVLEHSNKIVRDLEGQPVELLDIIDKAVVAGMELEATRHNSKCENIWQTLAAFRNIIGKLPKMITPDIEESLLHTLTLVDECLIENKPQTIVP